MAAEQSYKPVTLYTPRLFKLSGFELIDPSQKVEEENVPFYHEDEYYPMRIGEIINNRFQIVSKLGYGATSTVWLCRDLRSMTHNHELDVYRYLSNFAKDTKGRKHIRSLKDSFKLKSLYGEHDVFVMTPMGVSLRALQELQKHGIFPQYFVVTVLNQILKGLFFLHQIGVIHTDLHADNLLLAIRDPVVLAQAETDELVNPSARKQVGDTVIYKSRYMLEASGRITICDLGQARIGSEHSGRIMPLQHRAPEVILKMRWNRAVDMWSIGILAWDLIERARLFRVYDLENEELNDAYHLAAMTAVLGPPPPEFLSRSEETRKYWDADGKWQGSVPLPIGRSLEFLAKSLTGDDRDQFLDFIQGLLSWLPEKRPTVEETYLHLWLCHKN